MNFLTITLQAQPAQQGGGGLSLIIMMVAIFAIMYFLMIRPQQKKQKELQRFRNELQRGDKVVTIGGIYGTIDEINGNHVLMRVDTNVRIKVAKSSIVKDFSDVQQ
ncbi:MAG: preprotein translocase subunit YajC [Bacteroidales bacterium]|nr:preprotein translocase subunit YajC [Bacteroidales bacterium]MBQ1885720.1 preprotein translocase subunit YajC [Bacteroidales bacterium]MBR2135238.1 preprotein translocase subunit YajC [Bacteroidales bacterium]